jgi:hypothetical protein
MCNEFLKENFHGGVELFSLEFRKVSKVYNDLELQSASLIKKMFLLLECSDCEL